MSPLHNALRAHLHLDSGRFDVVFEYLPAETDTGCDDDYQLVSLRERGREVTLEEVAYREALATGIIGGEHETEKMLLDAALDQERAYGWPADADPIHHELTAEGVAELAAMCPANVHELAEAVGQ